MAMRDILAVALVDTHILSASPLAGRPVDRLQLTLDYDNANNVGNGQIGRIGLICPIRLGNALRLAATVDEFPGI
jgi:hypothetical protein